LGGVPRARMYDTPRGRGSTAPSLSDSEFSASGVQRLNQCGGYGMQRQLSVITQVDTDTARLPADAKLPRQNRLLPPAATRLRRPSACLAVSDGFRPRYTPAFLATAIPSRCLSRMTDLSNSAKLHSILNSSLLIALSSPVNGRFSFRNPIPNATSVARSESPP
jgi:hypothetical protein